MDRAAYRFGEPRSNPSLRCLIGWLGIAHTPSSCASFKRAPGFLEYKTRSPLGLFTESEKVYDLAPDLPGFRCSAQEIEKSEK